MQKCRFASYSLSSFWICLSRLGERFRDFMHSPMLQSQTQSPDQVPIVLYKSPRPQVLPLRIIPEYSFVDNSPVQDFPLFPRLSSGQLMLTGRACCIIIALLTTIDPGHVSSCLRSGVMTHIITSLHYQHILKITRHLHAFINFSERVLLEV